MTEKKDNKPKRSGLAFKQDYKLSILLILGIFIGVNFISSLLHFRLDVTSDNLYTLADGTRSIIEKINTPLTIKYFFAENHKEIPQAIKNYGNNVRELLEEYERVNPAMIKLELINPLPDTDEEEWAGRYGIQAIQDFSLSENYYMGMALINEDREAVIPFFDPRKETSLEYDISKAIYEITKSGTFTVGVYTSLPIKGSAENPYTQQPAQPEWVFYTELQKLYKTELLSPDNVQEIPDNINMLVVIHPKNPSKTFEYALDQFLMRGGKVIILTDPNMMSDASAAAGQGPGNISASLLPDMFKKWGIQYEEGKIVGDMNYATTVRGQNNQPLPFGLWMTLNDTGINKSLQFLKDMNNLFFAYAGGFKYKETDSALQYTSLLSTTDKAAIVDVFVTGYLPPADINKQIMNGKDHYDIAGILTGKFSSIFSAPPKEQVAEGSTVANPAAYKHAHINQSEKDSTVVLISDVDFITNNFSINQQSIFGNTVTFYRNNNLPMILNLIDYISGSTDLISIRSRGNFLRTFTVFEGMEKAAQAKYNTAEEELEQELTQVEQNLQALAPENNSGQIQLSKEVVAQINQFKEKQIETKKKLREIRNLLRKDIEFLKNILIIINLFLVPVLVIVFGVIIYYRRFSVK